MKGFNPHFFFSVLLKSFGILFISTQLLACIEYDISGTLDESGIDVECRDDVDNDKDGWVDAADPDCAARIAITELGYGASVCNDGLDNDGDGLADSADGNCLNALHGYEGNMAGSVIITEFLANPQAITDANGEWIELYNTTKVAIDIRGWILQDDVGSHVIGNAVVIPAESHIVMSRAANAVNGLPIGHQSSYVYGSGLSLSNTGDSITLLDSTGVLVSQVIFGGEQVGEGCSTQMSADALLPEGAADARWCSGTVFINGNLSDKGSPGKSNEVCP